MQTTTSASASLRPEATLTTRFLPGCRACGSRHPLAIDPTSDPRVCLACACPMPPLDDEVTVPAVITGFHFTIGQWLMAIGRWLAGFDRNRPRGDF